MRKIVPEILSKKILSLFVENKKKTYNIKQIRFFLDYAIDFKVLKNILYDFAKYGHIINTGNDKFKFNHSLNLLKGRIERRLLIARIATAYYFLHFLVVLPILGFKERTTPVPLSITEPILGGSPNLASVKKKVDFKNQ